MVQKQPKSNNWKKPLKVNTNLLCKLDSKKEFARNHGKKYWDSILYDTTMGKHVKNIHNNKEIWTIKPRERVSSDLEF